MLAPHALVAGALVCGLSATCDAANLSRKYGQEVAERRSNPDASAMESQRKEPCRGTIHWDGQTDAIAVFERCLTTNGSRQSAGPRSHCLWPALVSTPGTPPGLAVVSACLGEGDIGVVTLGDTDLTGRGAEATTTELSGEIHGLLGLLAEEVEAEPILAVLAGRALHDLWTGVRPVHTDVVALDGALTRAGLARR